MLTDLYQEYLFIIGKLKDTYSLHIDVDHKDIHTFYRDKKPLFKLMFGHFTKDDSPSIVISFHLDMYHSEAISWFVNIYQLHPLIQIQDSYMEDSNGETYLGQDALALKEVYQAQAILSDWLENHDKKEIKEFVESKVVGRERTNKVFDSLGQKDEAIIEFSRMKKPDDDEGVH